MKLRPCDLAYEHESTPALHDKIKSNERRGLLLYLSNYGLNF